MVENNEQYSPNDRLDGDSPWSESNKIILNKHSNLTIISHPNWFGKVSKSVFGTEAQWATSRVSPNDPGSCTMTTPSENSHRYPTKIAMFDIYVKKTYYKFIGCSWCFFSQPFMKKKNVQLDHQTPGIGVKYSTKKLSNHHIDHRLGCEKPHGLATTIKIMFFPNFDDFSTLRVQQWWLYLHPVF